MGERRFMGWVRGDSELPAGTLDGNAVLPAGPTDRAAGDRDEERRGSSGTDPGRRRTEPSPHGFALSAAVYPRGYELRWWLPADRGLHRPAGGSVLV